MRNIFVIIAVVLLALAVGIEAASSATQTLGITQEVVGIAIPVLVAVDGALLLRFGLTAFGSIVSGAVQGKIDGAITLITGIVLVLVGIMAALGALGLLGLMLGLLLAVPFGTAIYLGMFGGFAHLAASSLLSFTMLLKAGAMVSFVLWNLHVLRSKSTVLLALTCLLMTGLVSLLHGIVPGILVSITDAIAAIIVGIVSVIWGVVLALVGIPGTLRAIKSFVPT